MKLECTAILVIAAWTAWACGPPSCPCEAREGHEAASADEKSKPEPEAGEGEEAPEQKPVASTEGDKAEAVREALLQLFRHCQGGEIEKAADYVVYRGSDEMGAWKRTCNYADPDERNQVEGVCAAIRDFLKEGESPEFLEFETETESEGEWLVWKVRFKKSGGAEEAWFAFLRVGDGYALGDID